MLFSAIVDFLSDNYSLSHVHIGNEYDINDLTLLTQDAGAYSDDILYFCDAAQLQKMDTYPSSLIYYYALPHDVSMGSAINTAELTADDFAGAFETLRSTLRTDSDMQKDYSDALYMMLSGCDLSAIMNRLAQKMNNFYAAIDVTGKVLAHSENFIVNYSVWMRSLERGYCVDELMDFIARVRKENNYSLSDIPFVQFCELTGKYILCGRVISESSIIGYVFLLKDENRFDVWDKQLIPLLEKAAKDTILHAKGYSDFNSAKHNDFLLEAIQGLSPQETKRKITASGLKLPDTMRACLIQPRYWKGENYIANQIRPRIIEIFGNTPNVVYNDMLAMLIPVPNDGKIDSTAMCSLNTLAQEKTIRIGISNAFSNPNLIKTYMEQCEKTLQFAQRITTTNQIFFYSDFAFSSLLENVRDQEILKSCIHPLLGACEQYDNAKNSELYKTLCVYAQSGFNKNRAADLLGIHRNTINYRIQQIEQEFNVNLQDDKLMFPLMLSVEIDSFVKYRYPPNIKP